MICSMVGCGSGILTGIPGGGGGFFLANACSSSEADGVLAVKFFCGTVVTLLNSSWDILVILWTLWILGFLLKWHRYRSEALIVFVPLAGGYSMVPETAAALHGTGLDLRCFSRVELVGYLVTPS